MEKVERISFISLEFINLISTKLKHKTIIVQCVYVCHAERIREVNERANKCAELEMKIELRKMEDTHLIQFVCMCVLPQQSVLIFRFFLFFRNAQVLFMRHLLARFRWLHQKKVPFAFSYRLFFSFCCSFSLCPPFISFIFVIVETVATFSFSAPFSCHQLCSLSLSLFGNRCY